MEVKRLKSGWVEFTRFYCKEGHIDRWMGDAINDPNNKHIHGQQLNSSATFYRFNGGKWIYSGDLKRSNVIYTLDLYGELFTADEIKQELFTQQKQK